MYRNQFCLSLHVVNLCSASLTQLPILKMYAHLHLLWALLSRDALHAMPPSGEPGPSSLSPGQSHGEVLFREYFLTVTLSEVNN